MKWPITLTHLKKHKKQIDYMNMHESIMFTNNIAMYIATYVVINTVIINELKPNYLHTVARCSNISRNTHNL